MRKEIIAILLCFLVVFTAVSLFSFNDADPSLFHNAGVKGKVHNLFGIAGAHLAGLMVALFGLGGFWIPVLLLQAGIRILIKPPQEPIRPIIAGGVMLVIATGCLFALKQTHYTVFGNTVFAGGIISTPLAAFLVKYTNPTGALIILAMTGLIAFMTATRCSFVDLAERFLRLMRILMQGMNIQFIKLKQKGIKWKASRISPPACPPQCSEPCLVQTAPPVPESLDLHIMNGPPKRAVFKQLPSMHEPLESGMDKKGFQLPPVTFLDDPDTAPVSSDDAYLKMQSHLLESKLADFGVKGRVKAVLSGPVITTFEYEPAPGVKINKIVNLSDDLALALKAISIRIVAPIPGKDVIGIEIPNENREMVCFKEMILSDSFQKSSSKLTMCLGKDIMGHPVTAELDKMPHLLIAGATGAGKSVALNTMISSLLYKARPDEVKMIMVDPKRIELSMYDGIPHLIIPVVTDVKKATNALYWAVKEMERRYELLSENKARNIKQYNRRFETEKEVAVDKAAGGTHDDDDAPLERLPFIVIIIDELADLMMTAGKDVETALARLAQMARAAGIHLILATQRPSVDVLTGLIKANFPTRMTFKVSSKIDSRTIIDTNGAENLLGNGDMLFLAPGASKLQRIHGAYISEAELTRLTEFLKEQATPEYDLDVLRTLEKNSTQEAESAYDEQYDAAVALVTKTGQASASMIQRHLRIGYHRAARIVEKMKSEGVMSPSNGITPRQVPAKGYDAPSHEN